MMQGFFFNVQKVVGFQQGGVVYFSCSIVNFNKWQINKPNDQQKKDFKIGRPLW